MWSFWLHCGHCPSWYDALIWYDALTTDIVLRHRLLNTKHTTGKAVIWSAEWSSNDHIYYVKDIGHHKIESITSNVSWTAHQLLTTWVVVWVETD